MFIFNAINHIISLTHFAFVDVFVKSLASVCCLAFAYFCQFQPGVAYKSVAYKKTCICFAV